MCRTPSEVSTRQLSKRTPALDMMGKLELSSGSSIQQSFCCPVRSQPRLPRKLDGTGIVESNARFMPVMFPTSERGLAGMSFYLKHVARLEIPSRENETRPHRHPGTSRGRPRTLSPHKKYYPAWQYARQQNEERRHRWVKLFSNAGLPRNIK